jgi:choline dehydrogenase
VGEAFDFIVIGGGSAGAVIAAWLSGDPDVRVALIETGGRQKMTHAAASLA